MNPTDAFKAGDTVTITITNVPIDEVNPGEIRVSVGVEGAGAWLGLDDSRMSVELTKPADWPPQLTDVWIDRQNDPWLARFTNDGTEIVMQCSAHLAPKVPSWVWNEYGPLRLAFRKAES